MGTSHMLAPFVVKNSAIAQIVLHIGEFIVMRNHLNVQSVKKVSTKVVILPYILEFTMGISHMLAPFVVKNSAKAQNVLHI